MYPNRTLCDVIREMKDCYTTRNFSYLLGLIEEAQSMGNRMEAGLADKFDVDHYMKQRRKLKAEVKKLEEQIEEKS